MGLLDFLNPLKIITGPIEQITKAISDVKLAQVRAKTEEERIEANERLKSLEARRDVLIGETAAGVKTNAAVRSLFAIVILIYLIKVIIFDMVFGQWTGWTTPPLPERLDYLMGVVISFYFVDQIASYWRKK